MKTESEILQDLFGKDFNHLTIDNAIKAMGAYASQFKFVLTTCGKTILCDDIDYLTLRKQAIFFDDQRQIAMSQWTSSNGKRTAAPVAKLILKAEGKTRIHYKDGNPLNLKRNNIEVITSKKAHYKSKKFKTMNGEIPSSSYKGVSWSKHACKWSAYIKLDLAKKHLGYFEFETDAAKAYNEAAIANFGKEYSRLNVIL
jgi:hypothetical protein